ncbi:MAG: SDR family oxidoreductase [Candidatus Sericytochromatia bacterium]|nr:MAG: SDR family oxidoreductase [Candidatus Sericytochromatia bacterium]
MLKNKVILIIGGSGLIGTKLVKAIYENGAIVIVGDKINNNDNNHEFFYLDITSEDDINKCILFIENKYSKLDAVVNLAYPRNKNHGNHFFDVSYTDFCENVNLHLGGYFLVLKLFSKYFLKQGYGNIISFSSIYGFLTPRFEIYQGTNMTVPVEYSASKSAIIHLTKYVAKYLKNKNIRVNCISPGGILDKQPEIFIEKYNKNCLNKGMLYTEDIVGTVLFLLSDNSKYINGQNIIIDDGFSL